MAPKPPADDRLVHVATQLSRSETNALDALCGDLPRALMLRRIIRDYVAGRQAESKALSALHSGESARRKAAR